MIIGRIRVLKVRRRVSFWWPQDVPARALRMRILDETFEEMEEMWGEKVKWVSKVTPRKVGDLSRGMGVELI